MVVVDTFKDDWHLDQVFIWGNRYPLDEVKTAFSGRNVKYNALSDENKTLYRHMLWLNEQGTNIESEYNFVMEVYCTGDVEPLAYSGDIQDLIKDIYDNLIVL